MKRDIAVLSNKEYDLVIVGGGMFGICAAWDAGLRGLSVAIVEKADFCHATSANHFKVVHGGIRYLQHGDIYRIRESSQERSALLRVAPHLIQPLPIVIPTYGHGIKGKEILTVGMFVYDLLTCDRNKGIQAERRIPNGSLISRKEVLDQFPGINEDGLTGAAIFHDGQFYNPPRLAMSFLRSAVNEGVDAANYLEVNGFLRKGNRIYGVKAQDVLAGNQLEIRGRIVLNAAGPWAHRLLESELGLTLDPRPTFSRDLAFVVKRPGNHRYGLAILTQTKDADTVLDRGGRHLFAVPWKDYLLIGVWPLVFPKPPEEITVTETELQGFVDEVNTFYPGLQLRLTDILMINTGLTLHGEENMQGEHTVSYGHRSRLIDHRREHGLEGLVTLIGVRATTARGMAQKASNMVLKKLDRKSGKPDTASIPIFGGHITSFGDLARDAIRNRPAGITPESMEALIHNYGSEYREVLKYVDENPGYAKPTGDSSVLKAEIVYAIREEMAQKLTDIVFRRTDLGTAGYPGDAAVHASADLMAGEIGWNTERKEKEILGVKNALPQFC